MVVVGTVYEMLTEDALRGIENAEGGRMKNKRHRTNAQVRLRISAARGKQRPCANRGFMQAEALYKRGFAQAKDPCKWGSMQHGRDI